jgi:hypothetical protein
VRTAGDARAGLMTHGARPDPDRTPEDEIVVLVA